MALPLAQALPIMPAVTNPGLQVTVNTINVNLALPITEAMVTRAADCYVAVCFSPLATVAEKGRFLVFAHEVEHAYIMSCVPRINLRFITLFIILYSRSEGTILSFILKYVYFFPPAGCRR